MDKKFIQSDNYYVADTMNELPKVIIDNYVDEDDGGFKINTIVDLGNSVVFYTKTVVQSQIIKGKKIKKCSAPEYEVSEIDVANKQVKFYKVKLSKVEALSDEDASLYENRNETEEESAGQA